MGRVTQYDIARVLGVDQSSVSKILTGDFRQSFSPSLREAVRRTAKEKGYDFRKARERRRAVRRDLRRKARVRILGRDGKTHSSGEGTVHNLSATGLLLGGLALEPRTLPAEPFRISASWRERKQGRVTIEGVPARIDLGGGELGFGVSFDRITHDEKVRIEEIVWSN